MFKAHFVVLTLIVLVLFTGSLYVTISVFAKPPDRGYIGLSGFIDDYIGYVSYIKEGMYGKYWVAIRSLPPPQNPTTILLMYPIIGIIGKFFGMTAPFVYHASVIFLGAVYMGIVYVFFYFLFGKKYLAITSLALASLSGGIGWFVREGNGWSYKALSQFGFVDNIALRFLNRPHYMLAAFLFLILIMFGYNKRIFWHKVIWQQICIAIIVSGLSLFLGTLHAGFAVLFVLTCGLMLLVTVPKSGWKKTIASPYFFMSLAVLLGLLFTKWSAGRYPFSEMYWYEEYTKGERVTLATFIADSIAFGPTLWLAIPGIVYAIFSTRGRDARPTVVFFWLLTQLLLFFLFYQVFGTARVRFIQSLYFIPMVYGTVYLLDRLGRRIGYWFFWGSTIVLLIMGIPSYINGIITSFAYNTDTATFPAYIFPTKAIFEGYKFLDVNTPRESTVLANWEAANNIILYSHNYVLGNTQGWPPWKKELMTGQRDRILSATMNTEEAIQYVKAHGIDYVFLQLEERTANIEAYPFLKKVFENEDTTIYQVIL